MSYQHFQLQGDQQGIQWLCFDKAGQSTNTMDMTVLEELEELLKEIAENNDAQGLIIYSGKKNGFIAGADLEAFTKLGDPEKRKEVIAKGHCVMDALSALSIPTVAMIEGFCLGGGLELALACRYRVVCDSSKTRLGLPEVRLGIQPGWGGSVRLPRLLGAIQAFDLMLTGRTLAAKVAAKAGLVDAAVPKRQLKRAATYFIQYKPKAHQPSRLLALTNSMMARPLVGRMMRNKVQAKAKVEHYPAPFAMIDNWVKYGVDGEKPFAQEQLSIIRLMETPTAYNLLRVFFLQERLKGMAKGIQFKVKRVHVVGAGIMGGDIAAWCALQGLQVSLQDREAKFIAPAIARAHKLFKKKLKQPHKIQAAMDRILPDQEGRAIAAADVIIEAIVENLEAKQALFKEIEAKARNTAILATNTSSIPLDEINQVLKQPQRLVGIHFFNPVAQLPLVEIINGNQTDESVTYQAIAFVRQIDRLPLPVKSSPGFLVNRILMPYLLEAFTLYKEGIPPYIIDKAAENFGMPMGPIALADSVGLDICLSGAKGMTEYFTGNIPPELVAFVEAGKLGRKSGEGFYKYKSGKPIKEKKDPSKYDLPALSERLIQTMTSMAQDCLSEGIVADGDLLDAGMIFGTGFAPFRGGPLHYLESLTTAVPSQEILEKDSSGTREGERNVACHPRQDEDGTRL